MRRIRVIHVINSFEFGGAEAMLCNLLLRTDRRRFDVSVVSLIDDLTVAGPIVDAGIPVVTMGMRPGVPDPRGVLHLARHLARHAPDVVHAWMDHSNLIAGVAAALASCPRVVWGVHHCDHVRGISKRSTLLTVNACAMLSRSCASRIVFCSEHARTTYSQRGFAPRNMVVIPNGIDTTRYTPDADARRAVCRELGSGPDAKLVGLVARFDPFKDHATFVRAAALVARRLPDVHFLLCGAGINRDNAALVDLVESTGSSERFHLLGPRTDLPCLYPALDVLASSSVSEAFPLVLAEAMACGVPCAATEVGDSALIVSTTGRIVPPRNPRALAVAIIDLLSLPPAERRRLGAAARERICNRFDLGVITCRYEELYESMVLPTRPPVASPAPVRPLRILMLVESSAGGTGRHVLDLSEGLIARGSDVHLIYSPRRMDATFANRMARIDGLRAMALSMRTSPHPTDLGAIWRVRRYLHEHGPFDAIHGHSSKAGAIARLAALGTTVPVFYTLHGLIMMDPRLAAWKQALYGGIERALSLRTRRIIAVSPEEARAAVRLGLGGDRVVLVPNGVGPIELVPRAAARRTLGVGGDTLVIGFVGRLVPEKAPEILIRAFAIAARSAPHARLAVVGSGPLEPSLKALATRLDVATKVLWLGERDAGSVLAGFDIFALPSRKEGLPYVILEAMAAGLACVAATSAGVEILIEAGETGAVVPPEDPAAFALALTVLAADPAKVARYGQFARRRAARFTIDAMVEGTLAAYSGSPIPAPAPALSPGSVVEPAFATPEAVTAPDVPSLVVTFDAAATARPHAAVITSATNDATGDGEPARPALVGASEGGR